LKGKSQIESSTSKDEFIEISDLPSDDKTKKVLDLQAQEENESEDGTE
jgi:hypothetical protein